ncbi:MAG: uL30 family ribosomal protein [Candidatus Aenigmarchaeota archaeon]|nr:uL30 family ribosomal protein [Candidatus Aenigmarchaeota archaeon]
MYAVIRIRGVIGKNKKAEDTLKMMGLRRRYSMALFDESNLPMIKRAESYVTWGEISKDIQKKFDKKISRLNSPKKGFKATKMIYPKGDLGYRGDKINELIERMMPGA